jgi:hypothetical protein
MKIKYIIFSFFCFTGIYSSFASQGCWYLEPVDTRGCKIENFYDLEVCKEFDPITKEMTEYVQSIKKTEWKTVRQVVTTMGNKLCRWSFGDCWEKAFSDRYKQACANAKQKTIEAVQKCQIAESTNNTKKDIAIVAPEESIVFTKCEPLADTFLSIFKDVSEQEIARYHTNIIESSSKQYLEPSHNLMQKLTDTVATLVKKLNAVARSFEGFIRNVYNTWFTVGNG